MRKMTWDEFCNASEEEQIAELIGEGIERLDEGFYLSTYKKQLLRNLYKKVLHRAQCHSRPLVSGRIMFHVKHIKRGLKPSFYL